MKILKKVFYAVLIAFMATILIYPMPANAAKQKTIFIAAGHQKKGISSTEPLAPGSSQRKAKLTSGTQGIKTKIPEYKTNLAIAKATQKELQKRGYKVIMLRTTNDCSLSNRQRTEKANKSGAAIHICIHCNGSTSKKDVGPLAIVPANSKYIGQTVYKKSLNLGKSIISGVSKSTGKKACSTIYSNYYTTINYAKIPTFILECGFMSNPTEDVQLNSASYQTKLAKGIANGVDAYFKTNTVDSNNETKLNTTVKWTGKVTANSLNVRSWAGTENKTCSFSPLKKNTKVSVYDTVKDSKGANWYYIKYNGQYGFVSAGYIKKI